MQLSKDSQYTKQSNQRFRDPSHVPTNEAMLMRWSNMTVILCPLDRVKSTAKALETGDWSLFEIDSKLNPKFWAA
jgi:hypothetical protein